MSSNYTQKTWIEVILTTMNMVIGTRTILSQDVTPMEEYREFPSVSGRPVVWLATQFHLTIVAYALAVRMFAFHSSFAAHPTDAEVLPPCYIP